MHAEKRPRDQLYVLIGYIYIISTFLAVHADNQPFLGTRGRDAWFLAVSSLVIMRRFRYWKSGQVEKCTPRNGRETSSMFSSGYICIISKLLAVHADKSAFPRHPRKRCLVSWRFLPW